MSENQYDPRARQSQRRGVASLSLRVYQRLWDSFRIPMRAEFRFDADDPLVVAVTFLPKDEPPVTWHISRELLYGGLVEASGTGDVQVWPLRVHRRWMVRIRLECRGRAAQFEVDLRAVEDWLHETYTAVPMGEELNGVDWDAVVADLLGGR
ncbi:SsgA family sporulation/cell division regulator [Streptomyces sp. NPDC005708]|uniref:SsgA family sporulation/cell division regulator n=1 Tax=Streptomyces sp. NPDC005708 TaxID=3154564 RepID=UPI0033E761B4